MQETSMTKHPQFQQSDKYFACPNCGLALALYVNSLRCANRHTFDLAKQGYVNLAPQVKQSSNYDKASFDNRQAFLEAGYYDPLYQAIEDKVRDLGLQSVMDIGCGGLLFSETIPGLGFGYSSL